jgi:hypothetical protein
MAKPYSTAALPVGTVIEPRDGFKVKKTHRSGGEPFPWTSEAGTEFSDEWAARAIAEGAAVTEPKEQM